MTEFQGTKKYAPNWSEEIFVVKKVKNTVPWTYVLNDLNGEEIVGSFYEKKLQKTNQKEFTIEKVIRCGSRTAATSKMECFVIIVNG